jgi:hypothetical protein
LLAGLRADPRFKKILAPARARAAAQVAAAQAARSACLQLREGAGAGQAAHDDAR